MKLYLDDIRQPPDDSWELVKDHAEAIARLNLEDDIEVVSLDHDLAIEHYGKPAQCSKGCGCLVLDYLEIRVRYDDEYTLPEILIHTMNPVAKERMLKQVEKIKRLTEKP